MHRIIDPRTGELVSLFSTTELETELEVWRLGECVHPATSLRRFRTKNGGEQICEQCLICGVRTTNPQKHEDKASLPVADLTLQGCYQAERTRDRNAIYVKHIDLEKARDASSQKEYDAYIRSEAWRQKRQLVLSRCKGTCEGCGTAKATQVHHLNYRSFKNEFLFDLVGICRPCHDRLHEA